MLTAAGVYTSAMKRGRNCFTFKVQQLYKENKWEAASTTVKIINYKLIKLCSGGLNYTAEGAKRSKREENFLQLFDSMFAPVLSVSK